MSSNKQLAEIYASQINQLGLKDAFETAMHDKDMDTVAMILGAVADEWSKKLYKLNTMYRSRPDFASYIRAVLLTPREIARLEQV